MNKILYLFLLLCSKLTLNCAETAQKPVLPLSNFIKIYFIRIDQQIKFTKQKKRPLRMPISQHESNQKRHIDYLENLKIKTLSAWQARDNWAILRQLPSDLRSQAFESEPDFATMVESSSSKID